MLIFLNINRQIYVAQYQKIYETPVKRILQKRKIKKMYETVNEKGKNFLAYILEFYIVRNEHLT